MKEGEEPVFIYNHRESKHLKCFDSLFNGLKSFDPLKTAGAFAPAVSLLNAANSIPSDAFMHVGGTYCIPI